MGPKFKNRREAGQRLARALVEYSGRDDAVVLALPRGGVPVAYEIARALGLPLDVFIVRKVGLPMQPELAMGAVASGGVLIRNERVLGQVHLPQARFDEVVRREREELARRETVYRAGRPPLVLEGRTALVVDDGLATGSSMEAAIEALRRQGAAHIVVAVPVGPTETLARMRRSADEVVCLETPEPFYAVGQAYDDFEPTEDEEVRSLLAEPARATTGGRKGEEVPVRVTADGVQLDGELAVPPEALGIVAFAHGSGSGRRSPRNRYVAERLRRAGLGTLLFDLLTPDEGARDEITRELRFDIPLLGDRLVAAVDWLARRPETQGHKLGCFGASTGAAAALIAAARRPEIVGAVVSRGGRPDLAAPVLGRVRAPTLLIVGSRDRQVIELNREAQAQLTCEKRLELVPRATHLFEEPGALELVADHAAEWFRHWLGGEQPHLKLAG